MLKVTLSDRWTAELRGTHSLASAHGGCGLGSWAPHKARDNVGLFAASNPLSPAFPPRVLGAPEQRSCDPAACIWRGARGPTQGPLLTSSPSPPSGLSTSGCSVPSVTGPLQPARSDPSHLHSHRRPPGATAALGKGMRVSLSRPAGETDNSRAAGGSGGGGGGRPWSGRKSNLVQRGRAAGAGHRGALHR